MKRMMILLLLTPALLIPASPLVALKQRKVNEQDPQGPVVHVQACVQLTGADFQRGEQIPEVLRQLREKAYYHAYYYATAPDREGLTLNDIPEPLDDNTVFVPVRYVGKEETAKAIALLPSCLPFSYVAPSLKNVQCVLPFGLKDKRTMPIGRIQFALTYQSAQDEEGKEKSFKDGLMVLIRNVAARKAAESEDAEWEQVEHDLEGWSDDL